MDTKQKITVLIPLWNNEKYIGQTIQSVLNQTYKNFEILVINDATTDKSINIIQAFGDPRIKILNNEKNYGSVYSRNKGISEIKTKYMAMLDSDDIFYPTKLEKQLEFMESHPDFAVVGTLAEVIDGDNKKTGVAWKNKMPAERLGLTLLFHNCLTHSSALMRMEALKGKEYASPDKDEDYDLWVQLRKDWKLWNIPKVLTQYRIHETNISKTATTKTYVFNQILKELKKLQIDISQEEICVHRTNYLYKQPDIKNFIYRREVWLQKLKNANAVTHYFSEKTFNEVLSERWLDSCSSNAYVGLWMWFVFWKSNLSLKSITMHPIKITKFFIKSILKKE